jgi:hypothetical protein
MRSDRLAEVGLSARTRDNNGALLERWRAQCGMTGLTILDPVVGRLSERPGALPRCLFVGHIVMVKVM